MNIVVPDGCAVDMETGNRFACYPNNVPPGAALDSDPHSNQTPMKQTLLSLLLLITATFSASADTLAQWNFNSLTPDGNTGTGTTTPSLGSGTASLVGGASQSFFGGSTADAGSTDNSGWSSNTRRQAPATRRAGLNSGSALLALRASSLPGSKGTAPLPPSTPASNIPSTARPLLMVR